MDTLFVHDTITQIRTVIDTVHKVDTLFAFVSKIDSNARNWFPWLGLGLTILGWFVGLIFSRTNSKKSFEEGVLDKIRQEFNGALFDYMNWLGNLHSKIHLILGVPIQATYADYKEIEVLILEDKFTQLNDMYTSYNQLFRHLEQIFQVVNDGHQRMQSTTQALVKERLTSSIDLTVKMAEHSEVILNQKTFAQQFFDAVQYDCLKSLKRTKTFQGRDNLGRLFYKDLNWKRHYYNLSRWTKFKVWIHGIFNLKHIRKRNK